MGQQVMVTTELVRLGLNSQVNVKLNWLGQVTGQFKSLKCQKIFINAMKNLEIMKNGKKNNKLEKMAKTTKVGKKCMKITKS